ncbi:hypothetical protein EVAR_84491_1 [Eumeta japonica]|uniref:Uncharacterized protein n=1 Tax=Eumeta variegata TaxID=151549 RepID=A0A4C1UHH4_EUMVA|nr:hypothetical protein EVAR_84491_1 [Eumeta japonica]
MEESERKVHPWPRRIGAERDTITMGARHCFIHAQVTSLARPGTRPAPTLRPRTLCRLHEEATPGRVPCLDRFLTPGGRASLCSLRLQCRKLTAFSIYSSEGPYRFRGFDKSNFFSNSPLGGIGYIGITAHA